MNVITTTTPVAVLVVLGLALATVSAEEKPATTDATARPEVQRPRDTDPDPSRALPFAFTVKKVAWGGLGKTDFPQPFFRIEDQLALALGVPGLRPGKLTRA